MNPDDYGYLPPKTEPEDLTFEDGFLAASKALSKLPKKIEAIKTVRDITGMNLTNSKHFVDKAMEENNNFTHLQNNEVQQKHIKTLEDQLATAEEIILRKERMYQDQNTALEKQRHAIQRANAILRMIEDAASSNMSRQHLTNLIHQAQALI